MKIIIDTDPGVDDALALALAFQSPAFEILGLTTVYGNNPVRLSYRNALMLARLFGSDCPVVLGAEAPLTRGKDGYSGFIHGDDGLGGLFPHLTLHDDAPHRPTDAARFIADQAAGDVTLVCLGPLTNIALALEQDPGIATRFGRVVVMGGAFGIKGRAGNVTANAEANIHNDPEAAAAVFAAMRPVTVFGLDATTDFVLGEAFFAALAARNGVVGRFLRSVAEPYLAFYRKRDNVDGGAMHDVLPVAWLLAPDAFAGRTGTVRIDTAGDIGRSTFTPGDDGPAEIVLDVDHARVERLFLDAFAR